MISEVCIDFHYGDRLQRKVRDFGQIQPLLLKNADKLPGNQDKFYITSIHGHHHAFECGMGINALLRYSVEHSSVNQPSAGAVTLHDSVWARVCVSTKEGNGVVVSRRKQEECDSLVGDASREIFGRDHRIHNKKHGVNRICGRRHRLLH